MINNGQGTGLIFLDFDGVLHPVGCKINQYFCKLPLLVSLLEKYPSVNIVISTSWRLAFDRDIFYECFMPSLRYRIINFTPEVPRPDNGFWRQAEIEEWIYRHEYKNKWIALDDAIYEFELGFKNLIHCNQKTGITEKEIQLLENWINT